MQQSTAMANLLYSLLFGVVVDSDDMDADLYTTQFLEIREKLAQAIEAVNVNGVTYITLPTLVARLQIPAEFRSV